MGLRRWLGQWNRSSGINAEYGLIKLGQREEKLVAQMRDIFNIIIHEFTEKFGIFNGSSVYAKELNDLKESYEREKSYKIKANNDRLTEHLTAIPGFQQLMLRHSQEFWLEKSFRNYAYTVFKNELLNSGQITDMELLDEIATKVSRDSRIIDTYLLTTKELMIGLTVVLASVGILYFFLK
eukprot:TRINITY_DN5756_c0_g1_i3.p1 TRINITY_DN5756_c0_g1~~TRINITY_DN5756_c0_g1_i3.p1  ORF type:complete len:181 (+),score=44.76 TRINITY_DN5756_c0_g1_i3:639-1181(+)